MPPKRMSSKNPVHTLGINYGSPIDCSSPPSNCYKGKHFTGAHLQFQRFSQLSWQKQGSRQADMVLQKLRGLHPDPQAAEGVCHSGHGLGICVLRPCLFEVSVYHGLEALYELETGQRKSLLGSSYTMPDLL